MYKSIFFSHISLWFYEIVYHFIRKTIISGEIKIELLRSSQLTQMID